MEGVLLMIPIYQSCILCGTKVPSPTAPAVGTKIRKNTRKVCTNIVHTRPHTAKGRKEGVNLLIHSQSTAAAGAVFLCDVRAAPRAGTVLFLLVKYTHICEFYAASIVRV